MSYKNHLYNFTVVAIIMAITDFFYLSSMSSFFNNLLIKIQGSPITLDLFSTFLVYIALVFQVYYFVLKNKDNYKSTQQIIIDSFLIGLTTYAVYEYTNKAIFKKWTYEATIYDTLWGGILFSLTSFIYLMI